MPGRDLARSWPDVVVSVRQTSISSQYVLPADNDKPAWDICVSDKTDLVRVAVNQSGVYFACEALNASRPFASLRKVKEIVYVEPKSHTVSFALPVPPTQLQVTKNAYSFGR